MSSNQSIIPESALLAHISSQSFPVRKLQLVYDYTVSRAFSNPLKWAKLVKLKRHLCYFHFTAFFYQITASYKFTEFTRFFQIIS